MGSFGTQNILVWIVGAINGVTVPRLLGGPGFLPLIPGKQLSLVFAHLPPNLFLLKSINLMHTVVVSPDVVDSHHVLD